MLWVYCEYLTSDWDLPCNFTLKKDYFIEKLICHVFSLIISSPSDKKYKSSQRSKKVRLDTYLVWSELMFTGTHATVYSLWHVHHRNPIQYFNLWPYNLTLSSSFQLSYCSSWFSVFECCLAVVIKSLDRTFAYC